jgi:hypothetical protein
LYGEKNCKKTRRTLVQGKYKDKITKFGNSIFWSEIVEYVREIEGDGKDNVRTGKCVSLLEGGSWMSLVDSLSRPRGAHGKNNQTLEWGKDDSNWSVKASATKQHRLGGYNCGKLG